MLAAVVSTSPIGSSFGAPVDTNIQATYDTSLDGSTVTDVTFLVQGGQSGSLRTANGDITSLAAADATVTLDPARDFFPGEWVQVSATSGIQTAVGAATNPHVWQFQTGVTKVTTGTFADSGQLLGGATSQSVALGDLDGDGDLDAFLANFNGEANRVWLNQGGVQGGTLGTFVDSGQALGGSTSVSVALGDLDGDGDLDAFVANFNEEPNRIWVNQGGAQGGTAGTFVDSGQALGSFASVAVSLGDLDGDGDLDAFVANFNQPDRVWLNQGGIQGGAAGTFADSGQTIGSSTGSGVALGDLDGDGDLDAFVTNFNQPNSVWLNQGGTQGGTAGTFADSGQVLGTAPSTNVSLGDLDGDGDLDAFVTHNNQPNRVWLNQGGIQGGAAGTFADSGQALGGSSSFAVSLGDLDGDGDLDAIVANFGQPNLVWLNQGGVQGGAAGNFADSGQAMSTAPSASLSLGDLDGDGDLDAFAANFGANSVWINQDATPPPLIGDYNNNGAVDAADYTVYRNTLGQTGLTPYDGADGDGDGDITVADYEVWKANYGNPPPPPAAATAVGGRSISNIDANSVRPGIVARTEIAQSEYDTGDSTDPVSSFNYATIRTDPAMGAARTFPTRPAPSVAAVDESLLLALAADQPMSEHSGDLFALIADDRSSQQTETERDEAFLDWQLPNGVNLSL